MKEDIIETICGVLYLKPGQINEQTPLEKIVKDSMDIVELVAVLSDKYNLLIDASKMNHIKTIGDIIEYVLQHKGSRDQHPPIESF